jgi:hypothetical protein
MLPTQVGITTVGLLGLVIFLLVTALYTYRYWWRYFFAFSRVKLKVKTSNVITPQKKREKTTVLVRATQNCWLMEFMVPCYHHSYWHLVEKGGSGGQHIAIVNSSVISTKHENYFQSNTVPSALSRAIQHINEHTPHYIINQIRVITNERIIEIDG